MNHNAVTIEIRECVSLAELDACVSLQREVFGLPDIEVSPRRHLIVTINAGGWVLGAFDSGVLTGFVLTVPGFRGEERIFYSHMTAVRKEFQSHGIGAKLKWAQRKKALAEGVRFIKWTFEPVQARNAFFNLMRLGVMIEEYAPNFYGTDYSTSGDTAATGIDSDRLFAGWHLDSERVAKAEQGTLSVPADADEIIVVPADWKSLLTNDPAQARAEQLRIRSEFQNVLAAGLVCRVFRRDDTSPAYLFFKQKNGNLSTASP